MHKLLIAALFTSVSGYSAMAADAAASAPPASFSWTGAYIGAQIGYAWGDSVGKRRAAVHVPVYSNLDPDGFLGGIYAGYNYQVDGGIVLGAEADISYADIRARNKPIYSPSGAVVPRNSMSSRMNWNGAARLRLGYAMDRWMPYVAGGVAFGDYKTTFDLLNDYGTQDGTRIGWNVGAGVEYAATDNLILRAEYRYTDFGSKTSYPLPLYPNEPYRVDLKTHDLRIGITYKF